ncbi:MAG: PD-(D/E)XK nuclease family protein [Rikenellaceae bacterium]
MQGFLEDLAEELYAKFGDDTSSLNIILPNTRARLFLNDALSKLANKPIWQPNYLSIDEVMTHISGLTISDNVSLVAELYKVYNQHFSKETFDTFYFWGQMLLSDFDSIDKYLIDAKMLFTNIAELKDIEKDLSYLTDKQIEVIKHFWNTFSLERGWSDVQEKFHEIWDKLLDIYLGFKDSLEQKNMAYQGMIYRSAAEKLKSSSNTYYPENQTFIIAGFNALSECEKVVFKHLKDKHKSYFFWDTDSYYLDNKYQEAGLFMRENTKDFAQKISLGANNNFVKPKQIKVVSVPTDAMQCRYVNDFLKDIPTIDKRTAIVLTDENLLLPVMYSLGEDVENVNITMGYPLIQTPVYCFVERLLALQKHSRGGSKFYHSDVLGLLTNSFLCNLLPEQTCEIRSKIELAAKSYVDINLFKDKDPLIQQIFKPTSSWSELSEYIITSLSMIFEREGKENTEFFATIIEHIHKITNSVARLDIELSSNTYVSLLKRTLQNVRIPYSGEPLLGLQIMGILETRNLDFENVIILSMNDDNFPGSRVSSSSYIPYNLRYGYNMPTPERHEGVYAYYFYRLIQRAKNIHLVYSLQSDEKKTGEKSRYIYQLDYESNHTLEKKNIELDVNLEENSAITIAKDSHVASLLEEYATKEYKKISPTAFDCYRRCSLQFYFRYIAKIKKPEQISDDVENSQFGLILHKAMELLYKDIKGSIKDKAKELINSKKVENCTLKAIQEEYLKEDKTPLSEFSGKLVLIYDIIIKYINQCILPYDASHEDFTMKAAEGDIKLPVELEFKGKKITIQVGGTVDRLDNIGAETLRVVDYKTGKMHKELVSVEKLFDSQSDCSAVLQTLIYSMVLSHKEKKDIQPALYYVRAMDDEKYSPLIYNKSTKRPVNYYSELSEEFEKLFKENLQTIFNLDLPFTQCSDDKACAWCDYNQICRK